VTSPRQVNARLRRVAELLRDDAVRPHDIARAQEIIALSKLLEDKLARMEEDRP
jgi:hypothetical protein